VPDPKLQLERASRLYDEGPLGFREADQLETKRVAAGQRIGGHVLLLASVTNKRVSPLSV
jgi:hypothetical protein